MSLTPIQQSGVKILWKPWKMPENANPPAKPAGYGEQAKEYLDSLFKNTGLDIKRPSRKYDTFLAHVGGKIAEEKGHLNKYLLGVYEAIWKHDQNIEDPRVLKTIAEGAGLDGQLFEQLLNDSDYETQVKSDFDYAEKLEIWTIPSYLGSKGQIQVNHFKDIPSIHQLREIL